LESGAGAPLSTLDGPTRKAIMNLIHSGEAPSIIIGSEDVDVRDLGIKEEPRRIVGRGAEASSSDIWDLS